MCVHILVCVRACVHACIRVYSVMLIVVNCVIKLFYACYSPLHIAAKSGLVGVVKELINRGADLSIRDADGMSWLYLQLIMIGLGNC